MASKLGLIWNEVKNILTTAQSTGNTLEYVKNIYEGKRDNVPQGIGFPCIMLIVTGDTDKVIRMPAHPEQHLIMNIICVVETFDYNSMVFGNTSLNITGLIDFVQDVKNALWAGTPCNLNGVCQDFTTFNTIYVDDITKFPYFSAWIELDARILTTQTGR